MSPVFTSRKQVTLLSIGAEMCLTLGISNCAGELFSLSRKKCAELLGCTYSRDSESVFTFSKKKEKKLIF